MGNVSSKKKPEKSSIFQSNASYGTVVPSHFNIAAAKREMLAMNEEVVALIADLRKIHRKIMEKPAEERVPYEHILKFYENHMMPDYLKSLEDMTKDHKGLIEVLDYTYQQFNTEKTKLAEFRAGWWSIKRSIEARLEGIEGNRAVEARTSTVRPSASEGEDDARPSSFRSATDYRTDYREEAASLDFDIAAAKREIEVMCDAAIAQIEQLRKIYADIITRPEEERAKYQQVLNVYKECFLPAHLRCFEESIASEKDIIAAISAPGQLNEKKAEIEGRLAHWQRMRAMIQECLVEAKSSAAETPSSTPRLSP